MEEPAWLREELAASDPNAVIGRCAEDGSSPLCAATMQTFAAAYGAETGNIALKVLAVGGMYLGGGIAPKSLKTLASCGFMQAFLDKGRLSPVLESIAVRVILDDTCALKGAAAYAEARAAEITGHSARAASMGDRPDFSERAELEEQIDGPCSYEELRDCLRHLAWVNRLTRAHRPVMLWMERVAQAQSGRDRPLRIVDVGCGYGDMLRRIERWAERRGVAVELVGVDVNANGVRAAREATPAASRIQWLIGDVYTCEAAAGADLVTASGMTHHLTEAEIVRLLEWMERTARAGWFIVDLHRKPVPYRVFDVFMRGAWWHKFIRPDGLLSIWR